LALEIDHLIGSDKDPERWSELKVNVAKLQASRPSWCKNEPSTRRSTGMLHDRRGVALAPPLRTTREGMGKMCQKLTCAFT
jgi:hypothetical protein